MTEVQEAYAMLTGPFNMPHPQRGLLFSFTFHPVSLLLLLKCALQLTFVLTFNSGNINETNTFYKSM